MSKHPKLWLWLPRVITILFILFLAMFSLDVFDGNYGFWGTVLALFMHNIPVYIVIAILAVIWKRQKIGAIIFPCLGLLYILSMLHRGFWAAINPIPLIAFILGWLYWVSWKKKAKALPAETKAK